MDPGTDGDGMTVCLALEVGIVRMDQTQNKERMDQEIEAERRCGKRPTRPSCVGCSL